MIGTSSDFFLLHSIGFRTPVQVASHAQKYFLRLKGPMKRGSRFTDTLQDACKTSLSKTLTDVIRGQQHTASTMGKPVMMMMPSYSVPKAGDKLYKPSPRHGSLNYQGIADIVTSESSSRIPFKVSVISAFTPVRNSYLI